MMIAMVLLVAGCARAPGEHVATKEAHGLDVGVTQVAGFAIIVMLLESVAQWVATAAILLWLWRRFAGRLGLRAPRLDE